ncbi:MAG TPA: hypothetical protein VIJ52_04105 [Pseudolabrys sp.]
MAVPAPNTKKTGLQQMFLHGWQFMVASELINSKENEKTYWMTVYMAVPVCVMSVFATEIFLKTLVGLQGHEPMYTHRLDKLFRVLGNPIQNKITKLWDKSLAAGIGTLFDAMEKDSGERIPRDLLSILRECSDSFELMRYIYEGTLPKFYIYELPRILRNIIIEMKPEWGTIKREDFAHLPHQAIIPEGMRDKYLATPPTEQGR